MHYAHYMHSGALSSGATELLPFTKPLDSTAPPSVPSVNNRCRAGCRPTCCGRFAVYSDSKVPSVLETDQAQTESSGTGLRGISPRWLVSFLFLSDRLDQFASCPRNPSSPSRNWNQAPRVLSHLVNSIAVRIEQQHVFAGSVARLNSKLMPRTSFFTARRSSCSVSPAVPRFRSTACVIAVRWSSPWRIRGKLGARPLCGS